MARLIFELFSQRLFVGFQPAAAVARNPMQSWLDEKVFPSPENFSCLFSSPEASRRGIV